MRPVRRQPVLRRRVLRRRVCGDCGRHCGGSGRSRSCCRSGCGGIVSIVVGNEGIGIGHVDAAFVAADVVDGHVTAGELRQAQRLGTEVGERRSVAETHLDVLLHAEAALFGGIEQQRLGFDPTHRGGELPAQQFGEQQTAELLVVLGVGIHTFGSSNAALMRSDGTTSRIFAANSLVISNGTATRFGM